MNTTLFWEVVLHSSLVDKLSHVSTSSDQIFQFFFFLSIPEHTREHDDIFWAGQLSHFSLTMSEVLKT